VRAVAGLQNPLDSIASRYRPRWLHGNLPALNPTADRQRCMDTRVDGRAAQRGRAI
jgi:hypothetical protein